MRDRERERERERDRQRHGQREKQAPPFKECHVGLDSETTGSCPEPKAYAQSLSHTGVPFRAHSTTSLLPI